MARTIRPSLWHMRVEIYLNMPEYPNWFRSLTQNQVSKDNCGFESHLRYQWYDGSNKIMGFGLPVSLILRTIILYQREITHAALSPSELVKNCRGDGKTTRHVISQSLNTPEDCADVLKRYMVRCDYGLMVVKVCGN